MTLIPNRLQAALTTEERLAEQYHDQPARLMDLAAATGNRTLYWIARDLLQARWRRRQPRRRMGA